MKIASVNPVTNKVVRTFKADSESTVKKALKAAETELTSYRKTAVPLRTKMLRAAGDMLLQHKQRYADLITLEMGKPTREAIAEIEKCVRLCDYYAQNLKLFLKDKPVETEASKSYVTYEPLGIVLGIMPWNFPFWQVFRFAVPAMMTGNVCLLKHAPNVPQCALAIREVFRGAGFPKGTFQALLITHAQTSKLIADNRVQGVALTGSDVAGAKVAAQAGKHIKKTVLELGGSDPFIVLEDANLKAAAEVAVQSRMMNAGQSCIAAKRFIVEAVVVDDFVSLLRKNIRALRIGDPRNDKVDMGPMAREDLVERLEKQVNRSVKQGAKVLLGGGRPKRKGAFYNPTLLTNIQKGMPAYDEELFGPVTAVITVADTDEAIRIANDTKYGLGASLWTVDKERAERLVKRIRAGSVFVNGLVKSDPRLPFGGIKRSGYGRELAGEGLLEFANVKTVWIG